MKRFFLLFVLAACGGGSTTDNDAGSDSGSDVKASDGSPSDGAPSDGAPSDASSDAPKGDGGGGGVGAPCDPNGSSCQAGLLCCSEPIHGGDAQSGYFCEQPVNNGCPALP